MDAIRRKINTYRGLMTRIENYFIEHTVETTNREDVKVRLEQVETYFKRLENLQEELEDELKDEEIGAELEARSSVTDKYYTTKALGRALLKSFDGTVGQKLVEEVEGGELNQTLQNAFASYLQTISTSGISKVAPIQATGTDSTAVSENQGTPQADLGLNAVVDSQETHQIESGSTLVSPLLSGREEQHTDRVGCSSNEQGTLPRQGRAILAPEIKLPRLDLPTFSGEFREWITFEDLFTSMVHCNQSLTNSQKLQYLKMVLKGEASSVIKHLPISDANYSEAWEQLQVRYSRKKYIIDAHLDALLNQPRVVKGLVAELRALQNITTEAYRALKVRVDHWDSFLVFLIQGKLDIESRQLWARQTANVDSPSYMEIVSFLDERLHELQYVPNSARRNIAPIVSSRANQVYSATFTSTCPICKGAHGISSCEEYVNFNPDAKREVVVKNRLCFNCLKGNHGVRECKSSSCSVCHRRHHTSLHQSSLGSQIKGVTSPSYHVRSIVDSVLPTALVYITDRFNNTHKCRALLDSGSQLTLVAEDLVQRLKAPRSRANVLISGIGGTETQSTKGMVSLTLSDEGKTRQIDVIAHILPRLTTNIPSRDINVDQLPDLTGITLADPGYYKKGKIDIIIRANVVFHVIEAEKILQPGALALQKTIFGWIVAGSLMGETDCPRAAILTTSVDVCKLLQRFWELEEMGTQKILLPEETACEQHYTNNVRRLDDGRYEVKLPLKENCSALGNSRENAYKRLCSIERRLNRDANLKRDYHVFMNEYISLGHMQRVPRDRLGSQGYYIPHHPVIKESSSTTKVRVVFDASMPSSTGISLNDTLLVGPVLQDDLWTLVLRFRLHKIAISADICKMYRQIRISKGDTRFLRILWRDNDGISDYELLTVTYGTSSASYLATRTLQQLASDERESFPEAARILEKDFYVDDLLSGSSTLAGAVEISKQITSLLDKGGFDIRKWVSNSREFLETIPREKRELSNIHNIDKEQMVKTLGLYWNTIKDTFEYKVLWASNTVNPTKRSILSDISKIFYPLGMAAPYVIQAKIFIQLLWIRGLSWDSQLPDDLRDRWEKFSKDFKGLEKVILPRWLNYTEGIRSAELHGFADASESAYAAVVYLRIVTARGEYKTNLVAAKTKVAPVNQVCLPRLELCAAHLLSKLITRVKSALNFSDIAIFGYTDSTVVLAWLADFPRKWKSFVANRTSYILDRIPYQYWRHVASSNNPADCATRGISVHELIAHTLWWTGPGFLTNPSDAITDDLILCDDDEILERKIDQGFVLTCAMEEAFDLFSKYSSWGKLKRVTAYILRFVGSMRASRENRISGYLLTALDLEKSLVLLIKIGQGRDFKDDIDSCRREETLPRRSKLVTLAPFLDKHGLLRVGGRLSHTTMEFDQQHPILLSKNNKLCELMVREMHLQNCHAGPRLLQSIVQQRYWVIGLRDIIRRVVHKCVVCTRFKAETARQRMGQLPQSRVQPGRPFLKTGLDYAGPIVLRAWAGRNAKRYKAYIALFICLATKAVHIELVTELTANGFIAAFRRFASRRGYCGQLFSDNGTNFVGAYKELQEIYNVVHRDEKIGQYLSDIGISWHFIPPSAPHFGGIWEAGIKSVKFHLKRTIGNAMLTYEEMSTLLCQVEACLNSRPLTAISDDPNDLSSLTPAHFLIGSHLQTVPEVDLGNTEHNCLSRWKYVQRLHQELWERWSNEYVVSLQKSNKWRNIVPNLVPDTLVLIKDNNLPPSKWLLGRITETITGADELVRVAVIKTKNGIIKRPIVKLCPLPVA